MQNTGLTTRLVLAGIPVLAHEKSSGLLWTQAIFMPTCDLRDPGTLYLTRPP